MPAAAASTRHAPCCVFVVAKRDVFVIGSSLGGVQALIRLVGRLPADFAATVFVAQHTSRNGQLDELLAGHSELPVRSPRDGELFQPGVIYVAPPDRHLLVEAKSVRVIQGPRENGVRPAIDPLFRSAAAHHGTRVVGIVLTGLRDDGSAGLHAIHRCGGLTVVQDPDDAAFPDMPRSALRLVPIDYMVPLADLPALIARLAQEEAPEERPPPDDVAREARLSAKYGASDDPLAALGPLTTLDCPECGGPLWELRDGERRRFRCRIGHAFSEENLVDQQAERIERSLLVAMRTLEERSRMLDRLSEMSRDRSRLGEADRFARDRDETSAHAEVLRELLASFEF